MGFSIDNQMTYVFGVIDVFLEGDGICAPKGVTYNQFIAIFNKYLRDHPQVWHLSAPSLLLFSINDTYPCPSAKTKTAIEQKF